MHPDAGSNGYNYDHDKMRVMPPVDQKSTYVFRICISCCCNLATVVAIYAKDFGDHCATHVTGLRCCQELEGR